MYQQPVDSPVTIKMKITDGKSDALELVQRIHVEMKILQKAVDELEYLIYSQDERAKITFFNERGNNDKGRSKERTKAN